MTIQITCRVGTADHRVTNRIATVSVGGKPLIIEMQPSQNRFTFELEDGDVIDSVTVTDLLAEREGGKVALEATTEIASLKGFVAKGGREPLNAPSALFDSLRYVTPAPEPTPEPPAPQVPPQEAAEVSNNTHEDNAANAILGDVGGEE